MVMERGELLELCRCDPEAVVRIVEGQDARIKELEAQMVELKAQLEELKARLGQNSGNSNMPPSSDMFVRPRSLRPKGERRAGGQKGHPGHTLLQVEDPDRIVHHTVRVCNGCGTSLEGVSGEMERRQVFDIPPIRLVVTEHRAERKQCPCCHLVTRATFPEGVLCPVQYGLNLTSLVIYLGMYQLIPYDRIGELLGDLFEHSVSNGTLARMAESCCDKLEEFENTIKEQLRGEGVLHTDETGFQVNGERQWIHVLSTGFLTWYGHHRHRGLEATREQGILPVFKGTVVHDFFKPYFKYECGHALCNAHLLRELRGITEAFGQEWSEKMSRLLHEIKTMTDTARSLSRPLYDEDKADLESKYSDIIKLGFLENSQEPERVGKRGPKTQTKAKNLLDRCKQYKSEILAFMHDMTVPFENNQAERDIRMVKVQQKISGTFRSEEGAKRFCRIRAYISTIKKNKQPVLTTITNALKGHPYIPQTTH